MLNIVYAAIVEQCRPVTTTNSIGVPFTYTECPATSLFQANVVVGNILSFALPVGGIILFVMLLLGGIFFIMSGPDPKRVQSAKNTITYAILGVVILALAYLLIRIISRLTGTPLLEQFDIYL